MRIRSKRSDFRTGRKSGSRLGVACGNSPRQGDPRPRLPPGPGSRLIPVSPKRTGAAVTDSPLPARAATDAASGIAATVLQTLARVPPTGEREGPDPGSRAREIAKLAARKASVAAGTLALPVGPLGWLTILPELAAVWRIQAQMVADIAGAHGRHATLTPEHMLYCLFRYAAAQAVRDLAVRVGTRWLVRRLPAQALEAVAGKVGLRIAQRAAGSGASRWLPLIGAVGVGAYAWYDTGKVAEAAIELFEQDSARDGA
jgi:hypothetical protein